MAVVAVAVAGRAVTRSRKNALRQRQRPFILATFRIIYSIRSITLCETLCTRATARIRMYEICGHFDALAYGREKKIANSKTSRAAKMHMFGRTCRYRCSFAIPGASDASLPNRLNEKFGDVCKQVERIMRAKVMARERERET